MPFIQPPTSTNLRKRKRAGQAMSAGSGTGSGTGSGSGAGSGAGSHLPPDSINPHSHGPLLWKQLTTAGMSINDRLPRQLHTEFPHKALSDDSSEAEDAPASRMGWDTEEENASISVLSDDDGDDGEPREQGEQGEQSEQSEQENRAKPKKPGKSGKPGKPGTKRHNVLHKMQAYDRHMGVLAAIVQRGLQELDHGTVARGATSRASDNRIGLARARRAFGLLIRTELLGRPVDMRRNYLWAMGAELLMREGEEEEEVEERKAKERMVEAEGTEADEIDEGEATTAAKESSAESPLHNRRWGRAANIPRVRAYYEDLIQQFPYNRRYPRVTSALTFWPAMISTELYSAYVDEREHRSRLRTTRPSRYADDRAGDDHDGYASETDDRDDADFYAATIKQVRDIARRMDVVMDSAPYRTSPEMLRLRGMVSLYLGDLAAAATAAAMATTTTTTTHATTQPPEVMRLREAERAWAWASFSRLLQDAQNGGTSTDAKSRRAGIRTDVVADGYVRTVVGEAVAKHEYVEGAAMAGSVHDDGGGHGKDDDSNDGDAESDSSAGERPVFMSWKGQ